ncbi:MAG: ATP-binding protein, partial [Myxococcota bacterium]
FTTRSSGAGGLGLAITRRLVDGAGGSVAVTGADGGGAEFRVWLPCAAGDAGA